MLNIRNTPTNAGAFVGFIFGLFGALILVFSDRDFASAFVEVFASIAVMAALFAVQRWRWNIRSMLTYILFHIVFGTLSSLAFYAVLQ